MSKTTTHRHKLINYLKNFEYDYFELKKTKHETLLEMTVKQIQKIQLVKKIQKIYREYKYKKIENLKNELIKQKTEIFKLNQIINDLQYKNKQQKNHIKQIINKSNNDSISNSTKSSDDNEINYKSKSKKTFGITNKLSNYKLIKELKENDIEHKNKNHHQLKQEVNRCNNKKYNRLIDKIINKT